MLMKIMINSYSKHSGDALQVFDKPPAAAVGDPCPADRAYSVVDINIPGSELLIP